MIINTSTVNAIKIVTEQNTLYMNIYYSLSTSLIIKIVFCFFSKNVKTICECLLKLMTLGNVVCFTVLALSVIKL